MNVTEITSIHSWELLKKTQYSILIDVRTVPEFNFTGITDLSELGNSTILLPWRNYPDMQIDSQFNQKLTAIIKEKFPTIKQQDEINLIFMCRRGIRSLEAAKSFLDTQLSQHPNYKYYNISEGFEGDLDNSRKRGFKNGWKASNLPWRQG